MGGYTGNVAISFLFLLSAGCAGMKMHKPQTAYKSVMFDQWGRLTATGAGTTGEPPIQKVSEVHGVRTHAEQQQEAP